MFSKVLFIISVCFSFLFIEAKAWKNEFILYSRRVQYDNVRGWLLFHKSSIVVYVFINKFFLLCCCFLCGFTEIIMFCYFPKKLNILWRFSEGGTLIEEKNIWSIWLFCMLQCVLNRNCSIMKFCRTIVLNESFLVNKYWQDRSNWK